MIFSRLLTTVSAAVLASVSLTNASPIASNNDETPLAKRTSSELSILPSSSIPSSLFIPSNNWLDGLSRLSDGHSLDSLQHVDFGRFFDKPEHSSFFGHGNFNGHQCFENVVSVQHVTQVQCRKEFDEELVFKWAFAMLEVMKRLLTVEVCHVEKRVILHRTLVSHFTTFGHSLTHKEGFPSAGFDHGLLEQLNGHNLFGEDGEFDLKDLDFNLGDLNSKTFSTVNDDWSDGTEESLSGLGGLFSAALTPADFVQTPISF